MAQGDILQSGFQGQELQGVEYFVNTEGEQPARIDKLPTVSYTHLTLPTILLV